MQKFAKLDRRIVKAFKRSLKPAISIVVIFSFLISSIPFENIVKAHTASMVGTGIVSDPYIITTADQLAKIPTMGLDKCYELGKDIDLSHEKSLKVSDTYKDSGIALSWEPIGSRTAPFTGTFNGNGHTISNLVIGNEDTPDVSSDLGLFGYTSSATIKNVELTDVSIYSTGNNIGALIGYCDGVETITDTCATGNVSGHSVVGGLIGTVNNSDGFVLNSPETDKAAGSGNDVGGLIGNSNDAIINCHFSGKVSGSSYAGGLVGQNKGIITNSYTVGSVTGESYIGGLAGLNEGEIINSFAAANVSGNKITGSFLGSNSGEVTDGYWKIDTQISGCGLAGGAFAATGMELAEMQTQAFADTLNANIDGLNLSNCLRWEYHANINHGLPMLQKSNSENRAAKLV